MIKHLALIMDGNRRWAKLRALQAFYGHREGAESVKRSIDFCLKKNISYLSLYAFSLENFKRDPEEQTYLFNLLVNEAKAHIKSFIERGIRVCFIGDRVLFPDQVKETVDFVEQTTQHLTTLQVNVLFCYGARQEIVGGVKTLLKKIKEGVLSEDQLDDALFAECLWTQGIPEPDLIIRTGGHRRLSNFLLYQAAYSELYFLDCYWPDLTQEHLAEVVQQFEQCQRNFGI